MRIATRSLLALLAVTVLAISGTTSAVSASRTTGVADRVVADARPGGHVGRTASLKRKDGGYYYGSWGQDNRITVTLVEGGLRFRDPRPVRWDDMARGCHTQRVRRGVAAICRVPNDVTPANPMTVELELRLGDDFVDTTSLGAEFEMKVLADQGREEIHLGAGDDWVNGFLHRDKIWGGAGNDFIRPGEGPDLVYGEEGDDELVGLDGPDKLHGGLGNDEVQGNDGDDILYGDEGVDLLRCGNGTDAAEHDPADQPLVECETVAD